MPAVSVIIPAYNASEWLPAALGSLSAQTCPDWEAMVVDDGSTDSTAAAAQRLAAKDARIRLLRQANAGVSAARNAGIAASEGEYICFLDADDLLHPQALELALGALRDSGAPIAVVRESYGALPERFDAPCAGEPQILSGLRAVEECLYRRKLEPSMHGALIDRRLFTADALFRPGTRYEDLDLFYRLYEKADRIALLPQRLYFYRDHAASFIRTFSPSRLDVLEVTDRICTHYAGTPLEAAARDRSLSAAFNLLTLLPAGHTAIAECRRRVRALRRRCFFNPRGRLLNKAAVLLTLPSTRLIRLLKR